MIPIARPTLPSLDSYHELLTQVWGSGMLSNVGSCAQRLEQLAAGYLSAPHVRTVVSGDVGLMIALRALGLPAGAPCFVTAFTFNSTLNAALWNQLRPVFVDIDPLTYTMDPERLSEAVRRDGTDRGVVLATHTFGNPCDHDRLRLIAREHGHALVYDAAHGYGSERDGAKVGTLGDIEMFSLSGTKLVTSAEGGLLATADERLAERIDYLRGYGFQHDYISHYVGINGKLSELHAALGLLTLAEIEAAVARRSEILAGYRSRLGAHVGWQRVRASDRSTYKDVALWLGDRRADVEWALTQRQVQTKRYFRPLHDMPAYARWARTRLPMTEAVYDGLLCVPAFADITDDELDLICAVILDALGPDAAASPPRRPGTAIPAPRRDADRSPSLG